MFDAVVAVYNNLSQRPIVDLDHVSQIHVFSDRQGPVVFEEVMTREHPSMPGLLGF